MSAQAGAAAPAAGAGKKLPPGELSREGVMACLRIAIACW